ncbi:MAG: LytR/AlgR family response regulator transcription factor [Pseudomonadota bacterium]
MLIADDERLARERLERMVGQLGDAEVVASVAEGEAFWQALEREAPDIVLLDIDMPGDDGVAIGARLAALDWPPAVIYVTAHPQHALRAFGTHAVDYLLKPVSQDQLREAFEAAGRTTRAQAQRHQADDRLVARVGRSVQVLPAQSVIWFEADEKYVTAHLPEGERVLDLSLRQIEDKVGDAFLRVHRSALVSKRCIERLEHDGQGRHWLHLRGYARPVEVSRRQLRLVRSWLTGEADA